MFAIQYGLGESYNYGVWLFGCDNDLSCDHDGDFGKANFIKNKFYHVATTYNEADNSLKLFINGELSESKLSTSISTTKSKFFIAGFSGDIANYLNSYIDNFTGYIDDLRLYNRALSDSEIKKIYDEVPKQLNAFQFLTESPKDYEYFTESFTKEWKFKSDQNISGLTVDIINIEDFSNSIPEISQIDENGIFKVRVVLTPNPDTKPFNRIDLQFKDLSNQIVKVNSSEKFWSIIRTNRLPEIDYGESLQIVGRSGTMLKKMILASDKDDDPLSLSIIGDVVNNATFEGNNINVLFNSDGIYTIKLKISDGNEYITRNLHVITYGENGGIQDFYSDVPRNHPYYNEILFDTLMGAVWGDADPNNNSKRLFNPERNVNWAEALKMVLKSAAIRGLIDLPISNFLEPENYEKNWYWAKPYFSFALKKGAVSSDIKFSDFPTREDIGRLITVSLDLRIPKAFSNFDLSALEFTDKNDFSDNYLQWAITARLFNLFFIDDEANPSENVKRDYLAMAISKILRMPTGEIDSKSSVEYGDGLTINGIKNLSACKIMCHGNGVIKNEWIDSPVDYVKTSIVVNRDIIISENMLNGLTPLVIPTKSYQLGQNYIVVMLQNIDGGARNILTKEFDIIFSDSDFDGIQDREDLWVDDSRYSSDDNNNGIPDNLDIIYELDQLTVNESLRFSQTEVSISKIIDDGEIDYGETDCPRITTWARNKLTGQCKAFLTPCDVTNEWIVDEECTSPVDFNHNHNIDISDLIIALRILAGMEQELKINDRVELEDLIIILNSF